MFDWLHPGAGIHGDEAGYALTFGQVVLIDLALAGDNAIAVGLAASSLSDPVKQRRVIFWGIGGAVVLRILLALAAVRLLQIPGLLLAGGGLLLWVGWRLAWDLRERARHDAIRRDIDRALAADPDGPAALAAATARPIKPRSLLSVILLVLITDVSVSLDNVLAVAGAAHTRPLAMLFGLFLSAVLTALGASLVARVVGRWRWLGYVAVIVVLATAGKMIWDGGIDLIRTGALDSLCGCGRASA